MTAYWELLRDPRWQRKRLEIMEAANFACEECEATTVTLNVHHRYYVKGRKPWEYENDSLVCLCENCHKTTTDIIGEIHRRVGMLSSGELEEVLGYVQTVSVFSGQDDIDPIRIQSYEHAVGVAHGFSIIGRVGVEAICDLARANGGFASSQQLIEISRRQTRLVTEAAASAKAAAKEKPPNG